MSIVSLSLSGSVMLKSIVRFWSLVYPNVGSPLLSECPSILVTLMSGVLFIV